MTTREKTRQKIDFRAIEDKWQQRWESDGLFRASQKPDPNNKFYCLVMFAYPSGDIHMGHFRNYIIGDAVVRQQMMRGKEVLHPFGWDAFGLPAERAAIKRGVHPAEWTEDNIRISRDTLKRVGISFDWTREVSSCRPDYYKWTQWIFIQLFKKGLAYRKVGYVNWDPVDKTVLANEQVKDGFAERSGAKVEKKELVGWYFKITDYADRLIDDLDTLPGWPENVKTMQREWIGRSHGTEVDFTIEESGEKLPIFTTRVDTIFGVTFMAISPEAEILKRLKLDGKFAAEVEAYKKKAADRSDIERSAADEDKDGVFTGKYAINPFNGERVPLWVADYVLAGYGTGAVMAVPAHDTRDYAFAEKYNLQIKVVIQSDKSGAQDSATSKVPFTEYGPMINSGDFNGVAGKDAVDKLTRYASDKGFGRAKVGYKLKDWSISRQRYWGCPIPIIHCPKCGEVPVPDKDLPVLLPKVENYIPKGRSPLADVPEFMNVICPTCGGEAQRDPDTMDTFVCSSWYFLRYLDPQNTRQAFDKEIAESWMPIDLYIGGITHATGHLIYFRFFQKFLCDIGLLEDPEPALRLFNHGMVADAHGEVMSKSKGNVVSPIGLMDAHGVDVARLAMFFTAPSDKQVLWSDDSITGVEKFVVDRLLPVESSFRGTIPDLKHYFKQEHLTEPERELYIKLNQTIKRVEDGYERLQFNIAIAALMELLRDFKSDLITNDNLNDYVVLKTLQLAAPMAPHICEELWERIGRKGSIFRSDWPVHDPDAVIGDTIEIAIQVNGKLRDTVSVPVNSDQATVERIAFGSDKLKAHIQGKEIKRSIYVPGRILNIVVK